ncbi:MAG: hypothetical protein K6T78_14625 [Alicyclobacillus sp.]|nr:hypothetical protein [Alicyclobacillus sp.]
MWELMNGMANNMRGRWMPRRNNRMNTVTAMVLGASVGIAAWETLRRTRLGGQMGANALNRAADQVMDALDD